MCPECRMQCCIFWMSSSAFILLDWDFRKDSNDDDSPPPLFSFPSCFETACIITFILTEGKGEYLLRDGRAGP